MTENKPKTIKEIEENVDNTYLLGMYEGEYWELKDAETQFEFFKTKEAKDLYGENGVKESMSDLNKIIFKKKSKLNFLKSKLVELGKGGQVSPYYPLDDFNK